MTVLGQDLPRVTYFNIGIDLTGIHALFDEQLPRFKAEKLGRLHPNVIAGRADKDGTPYDVHAPADRRVTLGSLVAASPAAIDRAVKAARAAAPGWGNLDMSARIAHLQRAADYIRDHRFEIGMALMLEVGKSRTEAMGEVEEAIDMIGHYVAEAARNHNWVHPLKVIADETSHDVLRPYGVFAVISPFNFPLALSVSMIAASLLMGNVVVFKPTVGAVLSGPLLAAAFAGVPEGVFSFVAGGADVGATLTASDIDGVAFTGSRAVGMNLVRQMASGEFMRPVIAELGGKNAAFVTETADLDIAAAAVARAAFGLSGQKCSACSKVYVARSVKAVFLQKLTAFTATLQIGDPVLRENFLGPVINEAAAARFVTALDAIDPSHIVAGGKRLTGGIFDHGTYLQPTIVTGLPADHALNRQEFFVPLVSVQAYDDFAAAIADANATPYGLTAGLYTAKADERDLWLSHIEAGVLYINRPSAATTGAWPGYQGFCGWKGSGLSGKGGLGPHYLTQFGREQSRTVHGF